MYLSEAYKAYPGFQPVLHERANRLEAESIEVDIMR